MTMDSDVCDTHGMNKMKFGGQVVCPRCFLENESKKLQQQEQAKYDADKANEKKFMFHQQSMIADSNIKKANFDNYQPTSDEGAKNLELAKVIATDYRNGKIFNTIMAGNCGAGKTHLAYAIADQLAGAGKSVVFVTVGELLRKIKSTFNKDSTLTEDAIIRGLVRAEVLIVDDLGAELGALDANTKATNFINRVLFDVFDGRQGKSTIFTTNLTGKRLDEAYDERIVSRILNNFRTITFKETKDYRRKALPF
ncbi:MULTISPECIES: ATP-binding protein [Bacillus cereus group]|uniref:ATP-binding protein n=1 Tax=Bacillus cereus group TaxID=86661 RepID=UPI0022B74278|nr:MULTISPECIES: ATP-binding protein [Bacillus cereus group]MCZ7524303.1 ATP-binding protein [Bacillus pacificus]MDA1576572.1 ATP-binding protein [Bacillus cereus group sp. TH242-3LC]